jgi:hypothetical protein
LIDDDFVLRWQWQRCSRNHDHLVTVPTIFLWTGGFFSLIPPPSPPPPASLLFPYTQSPFFLHPFFPSAPMRLPMCVFFLGLSDGNGGPGEALWTKSLPRQPLNKLALLPHGTIFVKMSHMRPTDTQHTCRPSALPNSPLIGRKNIFTLL